MFPQRFSNILFSFILSGLMSLLVSGVSTARALGINPELPGQWIHAWLPAWALAFPTVMLLVPVVRKAVAALTSAR